MSDLVFEQIPTGRTHSVNGVYESILGPDGEPETEWALCAIVEGRRVPLQTYSIGYVQHWVDRPDSEYSPPASSSSASTAAPAGDSSASASSSGDTPAPAGGQ